jgi:hypothetical protein
MARRKQINLYLNGKQVEGTIGNIRTKARQLNNELNQLEPGTADYINKLNELKPLNKQLDDHRARIKGVSDGVGGMGGLIKKLGPIGLAIGAIGTAAVAMGKKAVNAFRVQEKAIAKVDQAIKSTGGAAKLSLSELEKEASKLQESTLFGDEDILNNVTAQLLTFTNIAGDEFKRTQAVALDLATVLDGDVKSASIQLGKALNDPVANLSALSRSGIQFSTEQKELIKSLAETNQLAEAQNVILEELERQYGGQAAAAAAADGGITQFNNLLGDLAEDLGSVLFPVMIEVMKVLKDVVDWFRELVRAFKEWDVDSLIASWMELVDLYFYGLIPGLGEAAEAAREHAEQQKRIRETVEEATKAINDQGKEFNTLIEVVKSSNTTDEQKAEAIDALNEKYGEYIGELDLTAASTRELTALQNESNKSIIENTIARQKQIEMEQALQAQMEMTQKILVNQSSFAKEVLQEDFEGYIDGRINKGISEINKELELTNQALDKTQQKLLEAEDEGRGLSLYGTAITVPDDIIELSTKKLESATTKIAELVGPELAAKIAAGGPEAKAAFEEALDVTPDQTRLNKLKVLVDASLGAIKEAQNAQQKALGQALSFGQGVEQASEETVNKTKKNFDKLKKQLEKIQQKVKEFQKQNATQAAIDAAESEEEVELIKLEEKINKKFDKEIEAARAIAEGTSQYAQEAQEALNALLLAKTEEYERERGKITEKYIKIRQDLEAAATEERHALELEVIEAQLSLEYMMAVHNAEQINDKEVALKEEALREVAEKRAAWQEFKLQQEIAGFEQEKDANIMALEEQFNQELITKAEYDELKLEQEQAFLNKKMEAELKFRDDLAKADQEMIERERERREQTISEIAQMSNQIFSTIATFREAETNNQINRENATSAVILKNLDDQLAQELINEEEYAARKEQIENNLQANINKIKREAALKDKQAAIIQSIINTAVEVTKALANPLLAVSVGVAGAAQTALIASQPLPQFAEGGFHKVKGAKDGKTYNAKYVGNHDGGMLPNNPSLVLTSEKGQEYFVPNHLLGHPQVADYVGMIEAIRTNRQFAEGGFTQNTTPIPQFSQTSSTSASAADAARDAELIAVLSKSNALHEQLLEQGVVAIVRTSTVDDITSTQSDLQEISGGFSG